MVNPANWSETPASNTTVDGVNIGENCPAGNLNGGLRAVMAGVKSFHVDYTNFKTTANGYAPKSGSVFTSPLPVATGAGGFLYHANASFPGGAVYALQEGSTIPALSNGAIVFFYS